PRQIEGVRQADLLPAGIIEIRQMSAGGISAEELPVAIDVDSATPHARTSVARCSTASRGLERIGTGLSAGASESTTRAIDACARTTTSTFRESSRKALPTSSSCLAPFPDITAWKAPSTTRVV